ncbi:cation acetate symporter [Paenibacillus tarimensis]
MNITGFIFFLAIIIGTLAITYSAAKRLVNTKDFYAAGHRLTGFQNGLAIAGDYMSAASFLGITGAIALFGFDGFLYSIGFLVSYLVILLVIAEPMHNLGRYTLGDSIAVRFKASRLRGMIALNTLAIAIIYMIAQLVGAGALIHLLLDLDYATSVLIVGTLMTVYVTFGGMVATSWVQIVKTIILISGTLLISLIVLARFDWSFYNMFSFVAAATPHGSQFLSPGNQFSDPIDTISLLLTLALGTAGLPHIIVRFFTVKDAVTVRRSVFTAAWVIGLFYIMTVFLGFGAASFVSYNKLQNSSFGSNLAAPLLAYALGGDFLMAFVSAVAFATILAVVAGLVISASSAFAHDFYSNIFRKGTASDKEQMYAAKLSSIGVGIISILLAIGTEKLNVAFLVSLAFAVAASTNLPLILFTLFWRRFNTAGAIAGMTTGFFSSVILVLFSPNMMHPTNGLIYAEPVFPLANPGIVSIPLGFIAAYIGTVISKNNQGNRYEEVLFQAQTGIRVNDPGN